MPVYLELHLDSTSLSPCSDKIRFYNVRNWTVDDASGRINLSVYLLHCDWLGLLMGFSGGSVLKNPPADAGDVGSIPEWEISLDKEMAAHSSILAWRIPRTKEPDGLWSMGSQSH